MSILRVFATLVLLQAPASPPPALLVADVRKLTSATSNEQRFEGLTELLRSRGIPFTVEAFTIAKPLEREPRIAGRNIVVTVGEGREDLIIGAHYDAPRLRDGSLSPGAVDNAASSVMLVHLAASLRTQSHPIRLRIVWFDMEELGFIGSAEYVSAHRTDRIAGMLNFDVNAYGDTVLFGASPGGESAAFRGAAMRTCAEEQVDCVRLESLLPSDDRPFGQARISTLSFSTLPALEAHQLWLLTHGDKGQAQTVEPAVLGIIHTAGDVADKVDGASMARMHDFALVLIRNVIALR